MTYQERLEKSQILAQKALFDNNIRLLGNESQVLRIQLTEDLRYQDQDIELITNEVIEVYIDWPFDVPMNRYRQGLVTNVSQQGLHFFDILPIDLFYKWTPNDDVAINKGNLVEGDLLVYAIQDIDQKIPVIFRVSEILGTLRKNMVFHKAQMAPYNGIVPASIKTLIDTYVNNS
jgi:hypothetical protein